MSRHVLEERAVVLSRLGRTEEAVDIMRKLADVEESPQYENRLASLLFEAGDADSAEEHLRRAREMDPAYYPAIYNLAYVQGVKGNYEDEIELLSSVPERDFRLDLRLSLALIKSGRESEGVAVLEEIAERIGSEYLWNRIGVALMETDPEKAGEAFEKALVINPRFHQAWNNRAVLLYNEGDMKASLKYVNRSLKLRSDYGPAWITRGLILQASSKTEEALESFREAHILLNNEYSAGNLAFSQLSTGDARGALKTCLDAFEGQTDKMDEACWNLLGLILMNLGHVESAEICFRKAISISPEFDEAVRNLGGLSLLGDVKKQRLGKYSSRLKEIINNAFSEVKEPAEESLETVAETEKEPEETNENEEMPDEDTGGEESEMEPPHEETAEGDAEGEKSEIALPEDVEANEEETTALIEEEEVLLSEDTISDADIEDDEFELSDDYSPLSEEDIGPAEEGETAIIEDSIPSEEDAVTCPRCGAVGSLVDGVCVLCGYVEGEEDDASPEKFSEEAVREEKELQDVEDVSSDLGDLLAYAKSLEEEVSEGIEEHEERIEEEEKPQEVEEPEEEEKSEIPDVSAVREKKKEIEAQLSTHTKKELTEMCRKKGIPVAGTKKDLVLRLSSAIVDEWKEMTEFLTAVPGVSARKAQNIIDVGFSSPKLIKRASVEELSSLKGIGPATAKKIKEAAKKL